VTGENSIAFGVKREPGEILKPRPISILIVVRSPLPGPRCLRRKAELARELVMRLKAWRPTLPARAVVRTDLLKGD
jgi:hypothetical protein